MERQEIPLMTFLSNPLNWTDGMHVEKLFQNAFRLRGLTEKMYVLAPLKHPKNVSEVFTSSDFVDRLEAVMEIAEMKSPQKIFFGEFSEGIRESLIKEGLLEIESLFRCTPSYVVLPENVLCIAIIPGGIN